MNLVLLEQQFGQEVTELSLDSATTKHLVTQAGARYSVVDRNTGAIPDSLILKRHKDGLDVFVKDEFIVNIEGFFTVNNGAYYDVGDVILVASELITHNGHDGSDEGVVWQSQSPGDYTDWFGAREVLVFAALSTGGGGVRNAPTYVQIISGANAEVSIVNSGTIQTVYTAVSNSGHVVYSLKGTNDDGLFSINSISGVVTLIGEPDFKNKDNFIFTVVAVDSSNNRDEQEVNLSVNFLDTIAPTFSSGTSAEAIDENSGDDQLVYIARSDDNSASYSIKSSGDYNLFRIDNITGAVALVSSPDYEIKSSYCFTVIATDAAGNHSEREISLLINNVDDTPPDITSDTMAVAIDENSGSGQAIYTATTDDGDARYSLKSRGDYGLLRIDRTSGVVTLVDNPDYEDKASYTFTVIVTDIAGNHSEREVSLAINNVDDTAPKINSGPRAEPIEENIGANQHVYTARSDDGDTVYSLKGSGDDRLFSIDSTSGAVNLIANPDYETKASYTFTVVATDAAGNRNEQTVSLVIIDLNEYIFNISSGASAAAINENSGANQLVYTVTSNGSGVSYQLKSDGDGDLFNINITLGAVTLIDNPDYESKPSYTFTVVATDAGGNRDEQTISLAINDIEDETAPVVNNVSIPNASMKVGDIVTVTLTVEDDGGDSYSNIGGNVGGFTLSNLQRINNTSYTAQFTVTEGGTDLAAASDIPMSLTLDDSVGNTSAAYTTAINQASDAIDANSPVVSAATFPNNVMKVNDTVTVTLTVADDGGVAYSNLSGNVGGFALSNLQRINNTRYTAEFTVIEGGLDVAAASNIPVSLNLDDSAGNTSTAYTAAINQAGDAIDANSPVVSAVTLPNSTMKVDDIVTVTLTVEDDGGDSYSNLNGSIAGFNLSNLQRINSTSYTAQFTVTEGGTDLAASSDIPVSLTLKDSAGNSSAAYTTAISQGGDAIDANSPVVSAAIIPDVAMKVDDTVTVTLTVEDDGGDSYSNISGNVGGFTLSNLQRINNTSYTAQFTVTEGGVDLAAASDIPVSLTHDDSAGNTSAVYTTAINQAGDSIDANSPVVSAVTLPNSLMKVSDTVTVALTVEDDGGDSYSNLSGNVGGFALSNLQRINSTSYTAEFTVLEGGLDVAAVSNIPVILSIDDSAGNTSAAYTTAITQAGDAVDANSPVVSAVTLPNSVMKVDDIVTVTLTVEDDGGDSYSNLNGSIAGFNLSNLQRINSTSYTAQFTVTEGGTDLAASSDIPVILTLQDSAGNSSAAYTTAISQGGDAIDANSPVVSAAIIPDVAMKVDDTVTVTLTVDDDGGVAYSNLSGNVGGFTLSNLQRINNTSYTAQFTVTEGGVDLAAASDIPVSLTLDDSAGNTSAVYTTAINQAGDAIDANSPVVSAVTLPNSVMKVNDTVTVTLTVDDDGGVAYSNLSGNVGGFALSNLQRINSTSYTAEFTVLEGGLDVAAASNIPVSLNLDDSAGNTSTVYTTAINQASDAIDANSPVVSAVTLPNSGMKVGDIVTVTLTVADDGGDSYSNLNGSIAGFNLSNLQRINNTRYTAQFTVTEGGTDLAAASDIPVSLTLKDSAGNSSAAYTTAISQGGDAIDANSPVVSAATIPNVAMKVNDIVTVSLTVEDDGGDSYSNISGNVGGFTLSNLQRINNTSYTAQFTVTEGGVNLGAASDIPVSLTLDDSAGNTSEAYTTAINQAGDSIDANSPVVSAVTLPNSLMKVSDTVTVALTVEDDGGDSYSNLSGNVGGFALSNLQRINNTRYTAEFTVIEGGLDVAAASNIPVSLNLDDSAGNTSAAYTTAITQAGDAVDANSPVVSAVTFPNSVMKVDDIVTVTLTVEDDGGDSYSNLNGSIAGFNLSNLQRINSTSYTAQFTVTEGGTDLAASSDIPVSLTLQDSAGNSSAAYTTAISQGGDAIDANSPVASAAIIPDVAMKVDDTVTVTLTVEDDGGDSYSNLSGNVGGFTLSNLQRINNTRYTAQFTVTEGGTDLAAGSDIPMSLILDDSAGNTSAAYTTAINQAGDAIDANTPSNGFTAASYDTGSNTITLVGTGMTSLLGLGETVSTELKANLDWSKFIWDFNGDDEITANVTFSVADIETAKVSNDTTLTVKLNNTKSTALEATSSFDALNEDNTIDISNGFSRDGAGNTHAADAYEGKPVIDSIVVFDLVHGVTSAHSSRTFETNVSYSVYILLAPTSTAPVTSPDGAALGASWGVWGNADRLGSDDNIILVGNGSELIGAFSGVVAEGDGSAAAGYVRVTFSNSIVAAVSVMGEFARNGHINVDLWSSTAVDLGGPNGADHYLQAMPLGVLTSQGLI